jgi:hypothetical protein
MVNGLAIATKQSRAPNHRRMLWGMLCVLALGLAAGIVFWWRNGGREQILLALQPDFTVTQIDPKAATMTVARANEAYVVRCGEACELFRVGNRYSLLDRGDALEFRIKRQKIALPILQEHVDFQTPPGGHG